MATRTKTRKTTEDRKAAVARLRERLAEFESGLSEDDVAAICAMHDGYSGRNAMLIVMQNPQATDVSGFKAWIDRGRCVRKGEHGIVILAPAGNGPDVTDEDGKVTEKGRQYFRPAYVFDVSQTDPLPEAADN